jgi:short-subunit dehydrogenase
MRDFLECTALITGASAGIGREMARQLAGVAGTLILLARRTDRLEALRGELLKLNPGLRVVCETVDLADQQQVEAFAQRLQDDGVELDFLINNAGFGDSGTFETSDWATIEKILQVNVVALTCLCHQLIPVLRRHRPGAILNVSSIASLLPVPRLAVYAATKAYVSSFSEGLRAELRGTGISVTHLCPGPVDTEFQQAARRSGEPASEHAPDFLKVSVEEVARAGLRAVARDRARVFPGLWMNVLALGLGLLPLFILRVFLNQSRGRPQPLADLSAGRPAYQP